ITPDGFSGASALSAPDICVPLGIRSQLGSAFGDSETMHDLTNPQNYALNLVGRMQPGLTIDTAKSRLPVLSQRFNAMQATDSEFAREVQIQKPSRFSLSTSPANDAPATFIVTLLMVIAVAFMLMACLTLSYTFLASGTARS